MFAVANYKALVAFELDGEMFEESQEIVLPDKVGEKLVQEGKLVVVSFLDPEVPEDKTKIDEVKAEYADVQEEKADAEEARDEVKDAELKQKDIDDAEEEEDGEEEKPE